MRTDQEFVFDVSVRLRDGVRDPAIDAIEEAANALELPIRPIAIARVLRLAVRGPSAAEARSRAEACAKALLVNPTLESYDIAPVSPA